MLLNLSRKSFIRLLLQLLVGCLLAPLLVMAAVLATRTSNLNPGLCSPERLAMGSSVPASVTGLDTYLRWWSEQVLTFSPTASWSCEERANTLSRVGNSIGIALAALTFATLLAGWMAWQEVMRQKKPREGLKTLWMAPTLLWAAVGSVVFDVILVRFQQRLPGLATGIEQLLGLEWAQMLLPRAIEPVTWWAAVVVLTFGGGSMWALRVGLTADLRSLVQKEYVLSAWANGLPPHSRLVRNLLPPLLVRIAARLPQLLGEVIVVEYVFYMDGLGRELVTLAEQRDAPALMTITGVLVCLSLGMQTLAEGVSQSLHPESLHSEHGGGRA